MADVFQYLHEVEESHLTSEYFSKYDWARPVINYLRIIVGGLINVKSSKWIVLCFVMGRMIHIALYMIGINLDL